MYSAALYVLSRYPSGLNLESDVARLGECRRMQSGSLPKFPIASPRVEEIFIASTSLFLRISGFSTPEGICPA